MQTIYPTSENFIFFPLIQGSKQAFGSREVSWIERFKNAQSQPYNSDISYTQDLLTNIVLDFATRVPEPMYIGGISLFVSNERPLVSHSVEASSSDNLARRLRQQIWASLDEELLEDGVIHPAEKIVAEVLSKSDKYLNALTQLLKDESNHDFSASVLRLAGRVGQNTRYRWRLEIIKNALQSPSLRMREAAVEAIEQWEDTKLLSLLRNHTESVDWLKSYIDDVIEDLSE